MDGAAGLEGVERENHIRSLTFRIDRETALTANIANELSMARTTADRMIRGEALNLFEGGYRSQLTDISRQLGRAGLSADFSQANRNTLAAIFDGENNALGQLEGLVNYL